MQKVLTFGTFDIFHPGHDFFLQKAKKYGDILGVVIARNKTVKNIKGESPRNNEVKRLNVIKKLNYVDEVFLGNLKNKYAAIEKFKPDVICLGYDQNVFIRYLDKELKKRELIVKIVKFRKGYKPNLYKSSKMVVT